MQRSYILILGVSAWANILINCTEAQEITKLILLINVSLGGEGYLRVETPILKKKTILSYKHAADLQTYEFKRSKKEERILI